MKRINLLLLVLFGLSFGVSSHAAEEIYFVHNDHLGTPQALTDDAQNVVWKAGDDPFGNSAPVVEAVVNNIRFPGQYNDSESGLHYNWNRYYDPSVGRYVTSDPIGLRGGFNTYAYVFGNPLSYSDPSGLKVRGTWIQRPMPLIVGIRVHSGATRPKFWDNLNMLPLPHWSPIAIPYSADFVVTWKVKCEDSSECDKKDWTLDQSTGVMSLSSDFKLKWGFHPSYSKYLTLAQGLEALILPEAVIKAGQYVENIFGGLTATMMCMANPSGSE